MDNRDIRDLARIEYEKGAGVTELSKKYNVSINTIKSWRKRDNWKKKQDNAPSTNAPHKKRNAPKKLKGAYEKEIKIQQDILNGKSKEEIMKENGISHTTYYRKSKNARQLRLERTEAYLDKVIDEVYPDLEKLLKSVEISKRNLVINSLQEAKSNSIDIKKMTDIKKIYDGIKAMGNDLIRTGKLLTSFELLEIDKQLSDESLQLDKINIEKDKKNVIEEIEQVVIIDDTDKN